MATIKTGRNVVYAYDRQPGDVFVEVTWHGPPEAGKRCLRPFGGQPEPIERYDEVVAWAVGIADEMAYPLHVRTAPADEGRVTDALRQLAAELAELRARIDRVERGLG